MTARIAISSKVEDARAQKLLRTLKSLFPETRLSAVATTAAYTVDAKLDQGELQRAAERLTNPITERFSTDSVLAPKNYTYAIEIGYLPGVTDNLGTTVQETIEDTIGRKFRDGEAVYSSRFIFFTGDVSKSEVEQFVRELHNPLVERASISEAGRKFPVVVPKVKLHESSRADTVNLEVSDAELMKISREGILGPASAKASAGRRGPLALSLGAMKVIRAHFRTQKRNPTDVELEALAQTWSEHCKHTIFADPLDEVKEGIYHRYIKGATEEIRRKKKEERRKNKTKVGDFCVSVFKDNSGAIAFDNKYLITHKVETHNAPSALDPFGGSVTAIVGVNRDALGFGLGAKPIANTYGFCVADPHDARELYRDREKNQPLLPARRILEGVVQGINEGGNQSGIPTPLGFVAVDPSYRGKPLVFGGTVGLIPRRIPRSDLKSAQRSDLKRAKAGDYIVMIGGRVGLDGIHGATFSSEALSKGSPATAVQIGDPITQKKLSDALIREARDAGLYSSITDNGAGGLSGAVGEMSRESGGCIVDLEKVPLKYAGLSPWQIWLSESQERMTLAVPKRKWAAFKKIMDRHDVEATRIGEFTNTDRVVVRYGGPSTSLGVKKTVMDLTLDFLHEGRPVQIQRSKKKEVGRKNKEEKKNMDLKKAILDVLSRPSIGSISFISQQYDHEVQGNSATKPLQGKGRVNADAAVIKPLFDSERGIVLAQGYAPWYSEIDTYAMASAAIDTAVRNAICAGASRDYLAILDNFCWSSSEKPERLYELKQAAKACYDVATAYGTPFISGKDSMFNDFRGFDAKGKPVHIAALPTILISAIGVIPDVAKAMTIDFKRVGDLVYLIGETNDELGCSEYAKWQGLTLPQVPVVDAKKNAKAYDAVSHAIQKGLIASALGVGRGGLAVALAKSSIAGQLGADVDLTNIPGKARRADSILFSESQGRILLSVRRSAQNEFEKACQGVTLTLIGEVVQAWSVSIELPKEKVEIPLPALTENYRSFFKLW
ncbi:phosphoribosylformylglycinamidine synthase [Candidatus Kaiserbacteria bacterium]|nr:phosphoribosylformylglycinamidine synthase [Candidatus Kaiserbacteria bacterium]